jgi:hypothetical protein
MTNRQPAANIAEIFEGSDDWDTGAWTTPALVTSRAALRHMLKMVENELGRRGEMSTTRATR